MNTAENLGIRLNGEARRICAGMSVMSLLREIGAQPERVAVMVNDRVLRRSDLDATGLSGGDSVEIVTFAGGGDARFERTGR